MPSVGRRVDADGHAEPESTPRLDVEGKQRREIYRTDHHRVVTLEDEDGVSVIVVDECNTVSATVKLPWGALGAAIHDLDLRRALR